jgi:hypothetical protein
MLHYIAIIPNSKVGIVERKSVEIHLRLIIHNSKEEAYISDWKTVCAKYREK